jgi:hypothetical protein
MLNEISDMLRADSGFAQKLNAIPNDRPLLLWQGTYRPHSGQMNG